MRLSLGALALLLALILPAAAETPARSEPLAEVHREEITADEVEAAIGAPLRKLEAQVYALKRRKLEALITERYHDLLYAKAPRAEPEALTMYARAAGLDVRVFERCLASGTHQAAVQKDVDDGIRAGVTGTPTFFINGRLLSGAQPLESFVRVIEEELARAR